MPIRAFKRFRAVARGIRIRSVPAYVIAENEEATHRERLSAGLSAALLPVLPQREKLSTRQSHIVR